MTRYFDFGFLATLIVRAPATPLAWEITRRAPAPYTLNYLHILQIRGLLLRAQMQGTARQRHDAAEGSRLWSEYLHEGIFAVHGTDWDSAFRLALSSMEGAVKPVPLPTHYLHVGLAATAGATQFLSFDPFSRRIAQSAGIRVLPEKL